MAYVLLSDSNYGAALHHQMKRPRGLAAEVFTSNFRMTFSIQNVARALISFLP